MMEKEKRKKRKERIFGRNNIQSLKPSKQLEMENRQHVVASSFY